ncbi:MAG: 4-(cytidine 5'-diphospho)-2-C-methyl-D-erythritol kinase [Prolixibacteraceae bacterium]|nr:4-(cytidine 5'-diphospho)-2-C-methyl-D-erythritol kinase [Prolixibacteraceae bacterium]
MIVFPNAKINLGLNVVERRSDSYHNIETVFYPVFFFDILEVLHSSDFHFQTSGMKLDLPVDKNMVVRAYKLLSGRYGLPSVKIHLHKAIPFGAGLGGGSSDAAFMLELLNSMFCLKLSDDELRQLAVNLGSDCPFFITNKPVLAEGVGDVFSPISVDLSDYRIILVKPPISVSTALAYSKIEPQKSEIPVSQIVMQPVDRWKSQLVNDFEKPVFEIYPEIACIKQKLYDMGAVYASMSGSGSTVYGIFKEIPSDPEENFPENYFVFSPNNINLPS